MSVTTRNKKAVPSPDELLANVDKNIIENASFTSSRLFNIAAVKRGQEVELSGPENSQC